MPSIRRRLLIPLALGFAALIAVGGLWIYTLLERQVVGEFDATLRAKAHALVSLTEQEGGRVELDYDHHHMPEYERAERPDYFQFWLAEGAVLMRSTHLDLDLDRSAAPAEEGQIRNVTLPDGRPGRQVQIDWIVQTSNDLGQDTDEGEEEEEEDAGKHPRIALVLVVARDRGDVDALLSTVRWSLLPAGLGTAFLALLLVLRSLSVGLRPLTDVAAQVSALDADSLGSRVTLDSTPRELAPIVGQLNALLTRFEASFERERRFTGNVAHELRTPIAELRSLADVGGAWPDDVEATKQFFGDVGSIATRMEGVVGTLLLLARCQAGIEGIEVDDVDVREVLSGAWARLETPARTAGLSLRMDLPDALILRTDAGKLSMIVSNLLSNAVQYARPHTEIRCAASAAGGDFRLELSNAAPALAPEEMERLTEPFWRQDASRSSTDHAGLGLSLVTALCEVLGLGATFDQGEDGRFRVVVSGPGLIPRRTPNPVPSLS